MNNIKQIKIYGFSSFSKKKSRYFYNCYSSNFSLKKQVVSKNTISLIRSPHIFNKSHEQFILNKFVDTYVTSSSCNLRCLYISYWFQSMNSINGISSSFKYNYLL